jgi:hypothetical protein
MTTNTEVTLYKPQEMTVNDLKSIAVDFAKSGYFQDAKDAAQAVVKIQAGRELGLGPVYSMTHIYIVKGKIAVAAEVMGALIKRTNRYDYTVKKLDDDECILLLTDNGKEAYTSKFTMTDAKRADLVKPDSGWVKWPRAMLMSKALSQGARIVCPHVISGIYTPEDFGLEQNSDGDYKEPPIEVKVESTEQASASTGPEPEPPPVDMCTESQRKKIFASGKQMNYKEEDIKNIINVRFKKEHTSDLTKAEASELIEAIAAGRNVTETGEWIP